MGLFKTLLVLVIMHRYVPGGHFSGPLEILGANWLLYVSIALAAVEVIVDAIPRLDIQWDRRNAPLRFAGAIALSWMVLYQEDLFSRILMAMVGVALCMISFTAKTSARKAAIRGGTSALVAPIGSVTEDCMVAATLLPLTQLPPMTMLMVAFMAGASMLIMYVVRKETRETLRWLFGGPWVPAIRPAEDVHGAVAAPAE